MAFCKLDDNQLLTAPNFVYNKDYELYTENKDTYSYPVDGWYWFDTDEEARLFFGLPEPDIEA